jgi:hypothetical protein
LGLPFAEVNYRPGWDRFVRIVPINRGASPRLIGTHVTISAIADGEASSMDLSYLWIDLVLPDRPPAVGRHQPDPVRPYHAPLSPFDRTGQSLDSPLDGRGVPLRRDRNILHVMGVVSHAWGWAAVIP